ncbi:MAG: STAS domain-containing protein [Gallionellaceae bacterium]
MNTPPKFNVYGIASNNTLTITISGHFAFHAHREFKSAYKNYLSDPKIDHIIINLAGIEYLDSSALGMLLVLRELAEASKKSLTLSKPSPLTERTFDIANFDKMFTIT